MAARKGHTRIVELLLINGGSHIDHRDNDGRTAVWSACSQGRSEVTRLLLSAGDNPTVPHRNGYKFTAEYQARGLSRHGCVTLLEIWVCECAVCDNHTRVADVEGQLLRNGRGDGRGSAVGQEGEEDVRVNGKRSKKKEENEPAWKHALKAIGERRTALCLGAYLLLNLISEALFASAPIVTDYLFNAALWRLLNDAYIVGVTALYCLVNAMEGTVMSLLSKLSGTTFNAGLLGTEFASCGRLLGDLSVAGFGAISKTSLLDFIFTPVLFIVIAFLVATWSMYSNLIY